MSRDLLKQAYEAIVDNNPADQLKVLRAIKAELDAPEPLPVAVVTDNYSRDGWNDEISAFLPVDTKLYSKPMSLPTGAPTAQFEDLRVQVVYEILCSGDNPPLDQHWEGFAARRIVDALLDDKPSLNPVAWFDSNGLLQGRVSEEQLEELCRDALVQLERED